MKISYNWLKEFVDLKKYPAPRLADFLTMNFAEVDGIETVGDDTIFDLKILPDRMSDCLSHHGVAREVASLSKLKVMSLRDISRRDDRREKSEKRKTKESKKEKIEDILEVENEEPTICKRYVSRVIKNVKISPSPKWLTQRLEVLGQKSINNIVDATNYVTLELGQPMHAFDFDKMGSQESKIKKIIIRKARKGEKITTLDNQEIELSKDILVIADNKDALAIAGVKGGGKAEIDENTRNIVLESANFDAKAIRKASRLTGIKTESSIRFAADLDPNLAGQAMERLASLIVKIAGGEVANGKIDIYQKPAKEYRVGFSMEDANKLLGIELSEKEVLDILRRLNFKVKKISPLKEILKLAKAFIGAEYKYGASVSFDAPNSFDCSSFTSYIFAQLGIQIPRISVDQYFYGEPVAEKDARPAFAKSYGEARLGDLVFANSGNGKIYYESKEFLKGTKIKEGIDHVGIYLGSGKIIHATRGEGGVVVEDIGKSKAFKNFRGFRRIIRGSTLGVQKVEPQEIFVVDIPTYRRDIGPKGTFVLQKADIIEEIGRLYGYQNLFSKLPEGVLMPKKRNDELHWENMAKNALISVGFAEAYNYSFIGERDLKFCNLNAENILALANYLSDDRKYLRPSLLPGFLNNMKENLKYFKDARIFEIGRVFNPEKKFLGGAVVFKNTLKTSAANEFYEIKASVDSLLSKLGLSDFWYDNYDGDNLKNIYHPMRSAEIKIGNEKIGFLGEISKQILQNYDIDGRVAAFEIDFEKLARLASEEVVYLPVSKYPAMERDLAIIVPFDVRVDDVLNILENAGGELLVDTDLFDIYEGDNISEGMKSLAFHLIFQSPQKTLSDEEVEKIMNNIFLVLSQKGWEVRTS